MSEEIWSTSSTNNPQCRVTELNQMSAHLSIEERSPSSFQYPFSFARIQLDHPERTEKALR